MIPVPRFNSGDELSREFLDTISRAITELQNYIDGQSPDDTAADIIQIVNDSGSDRKAFDVLGLDGSYIDPLAGDNSWATFQNGEPIFSGVAPVEADHIAKFAILLEPIAAGDIGSARVDGVCQAWVDIQTVGDKYADIADGNTDALISNSCTGSARILWTATEATGEQWAIVRIGLPARRIITARISGASAIAAANNGPGSSTTEWTYSIVEVEPTVSSGDQSWSDVSGGVTLTDKAFNRLEYGNRNVTAGGVFRCGIAYNDLADDTVWDAELLSAATGAIVEVELIAVTGEMYGFFSFHNQATGTCAE